MKKSITELKKKSDIFFEQLLREVNPQEVPNRYIECVEIEYLNGDRLEVPGYLISYPLVLKNTKRMERLDMVDEISKGIKDVRVYINTKLLEKDINKRIDKLFKN